MDCSDRARVMLSRSTLTEVFDSVPNWYRELWSQCNHPDRHHHLYQHNRYAIIIRIFVAITIAFAAHATAISTV